MKKKIVLMIVIITLFNFIFCKNTFAYNLINEFGTFSGINENTISPDSQRELLYGNAKDTNSKGKSVITKVLLGGLNLVDLRCSCWNNRWNIKCYSINNSIFYEYFNMG